MYNSLDIFRRDFLGSIPGIWQDEIPIYGTVQFKLQARVFQARMHFVARHEYF